jgi:hypothetical protein
MDNTWQFPRNEAGKVLGWSDDSSPSNPNASLALVNRSLSEGPVNFRTYATLAEAAGSNIPPVIGEVEILNYATFGDGGGARYKSVESEPSHPGKFQSANGAWWEIASSPLRLHMFGAQTDGTVFNDAAEAARVLRRKLLLPEGEITVSSRYIFDALSDDYIDWEGPGSDMCRFVPDGSFPHSSFFLLRRSQNAGAVNVDFPDYGDQQDTETENFDTYFNATADIGDYRFTAASGHKIQVGDILRIKSTRMDVQRCESRGAIFQGELNRVTGVSGNTITLEYPLAHRYFDDITISGNVVASGTDATHVNLSGLALPAARNRMIGVKLVVVSGTGAGQVRYVEEIDTATDIIDIATRWNIGYEQAPFSPALDATSVVEVQFAAYVAIFRPGETTVGLKGFSVDATGAAVLVNGGSIQGVVEPQIDDVKVIGATNSGISFSNCIRPASFRSAAHDCNHTALGYGMLFTECRDSKSHDFSTVGCRAGVDCSGTIKSVGALIQGGSMVGAYADADGLPWDNDNPNRGPGDHGQSLDWTWDGVAVEGMVQDCVQRGTNTAFKNIRHLGHAIRTCYQISAGYGTVITGHDVDARLDFTLDGFPADATEYAGNFIRIQMRSYAGGLYVGSGRVNGLTNAFLKLTPSGLTGIASAKRLIGPVHIARQHLTCRRRDGGITQFIEVEDGTTTFVPVGWEIERPHVTMSPEGNGTFQLASGFLVAGSTASTAGAKIKIDDTWTVAIADDAVVALPFYGDTGSSQILVTLYQREAAATYKCQALLRRAATTFSGTNIGGTTSVEAVATVPTGTTGNDGVISLHYDGNLVYVENRTGGNTSLSIVLQGF